MHKVSFLLLNMATLQVLILTGVFPVAGQTTSLLSQRAFFKIEAAVRPAVKFTE